MNIHLIGCGTFHAAWPAYAPFDIFPILNGNLLCSKFDNLSEVRTKGKKKKLSLLLPRQIYPEIVTRRQYRSSIKSTTDLTDRSILDMQGGSYRVHEYLIPVQLLPGRGRRGGGGKERLVTQGRASSPCNVKYDFTTTGETGALRFETITRGGKGRQRGGLSSVESRRARAVFGNRARPILSPARLLFKNWWNSFPALPPPLGPAGPLSPHPFPVLSTWMAVYIYIYIPTVFCSFRKLYTRSLPAGKQADACRPPPPSLGELRSRFNAEGVIRSSLMEEFSLFQAVWYGHGMVGILERIGEGAWMDLRYFLRSLSTNDVGDIVGFNLVILDNLGLNGIFFFYRIKVLI